MSTPNSRLNQQSNLFQTDKGLLLQLLRQQETGSLHDQESLGHIASNVFNTEIFRSAFSEPTELSVGRIIYSVPFLHLYCVSFPDSAPRLMPALSNTSLTPVGVRSNFQYSPNTPVVVYTPKDGQTSFILGAIPSPLDNENVYLPGVLQQGANVGVSLHESYRAILKSIEDDPSAMLYSSGRSIDTLLGEYSLSSETGVSFLMDSFQAFLRINESCGIWLNYFDNQMRLMAHSFDLQTYSEHTTHRNDEGEILHYQGYPIYPWEAVGCFSDTTTYQQENELEDVQLKKQFPVASTDLQDFSQSPIHRLQEYRGYLGQGFQRFVVKPGQEEGVNSKSNMTRDTGLFQEFIGIDGGYGVRSAKQILLLKYPKIVVPTRRKSPEDGVGDDLTAGNYRFSGVGGADSEAAEHRLSDWETSQYQPNLLDLASHFFNWKAGNAFHNHENDFEVQSEAEIQDLDLKFYCGEKKRSHTFPDPPKKLNIDHRYRQANYYNTAAGIAIQEDGSVVIEDGFGARISLANGQIRLETRGDIVLASGSRVITLSDEAITRTKGSIDLSSTDGDVRLKGGNFQVLAEKGVLIESQGEGLDQDYSQKIGEEVNSTGITLLAKSANINQISNSHYVRTGVDKNTSEGSGDLVFDVANGRGHLLVYANSVPIYTSEGLSLIFGPFGQEQTEVTRAYVFGRQAAKIAPSTTFESGVTLSSGILGVAGSIYAAGTIAAHGLLQSQGALVTQSEGVADFIGQLVEFNSELPVGIAGGNSEMVDFPELAELVFSAYFVEGYWFSSRPGNTELLENELGFSFRDLSSREDSSVYGYDEFEFHETRWQTLQRLGLITAASVDWEEKGVMYQGNETFPWPGKRHWVDSEKLVQYRQSSMLFMTPQGAKSVGQTRSDYENPSAGDAVMASGQKFIL